MSAAPQTTALRSAPARRGSTAPGVTRTGSLTLGVVTLWLSVIVLLPLAAVVAKSFEGGLGAFWDAVSARQAVSALTFTIGAALVVTVINAVFGTLIA